MAFDQAQEGRADAKRGKLFAVLIRQSRSRPLGGGDPNSNATLRSMVQKARNSLPSTRSSAHQARDRRGRGLIYEQVSYEVRRERRRGDRAGAHRQPEPHVGRDQNIFSRNGGRSRAGCGVMAVRAQGIVLVDKPPTRRVDVGAADPVRRRADLGDAWQVTTPPTELHAVRTASRNGLQGELVRPDHDPDHDGRVGSRRQGQVGARLMDALEDQTMSKPCMRTSNPRFRTGKLSALNRTKESHVELEKRRRTFTLPGVCDGERRDYTLRSPGRKVVLAFYPGDNTPGCTRQMCSYRDDFSKFEEARGAPRISPQTSTATSSGEKRGSTSRCSPTREEGDRALRVKAQAHRGEAIRLLVGPTASCASRPQSRRRRSSRPTSSSPCCRDLILVDVAERSHSSGRITTRDRDQPVRRQAGAVAHRVRGRRDNRVLVSTVRPR